MADIIDDRCDNQSDIVNDFKGVGNSVTVTQSQMVGWVCPGTSPRGFTHRLTNYQRTRTETHARCRFAQWGEG